MNISGVALRQLRYCFGTPAYQKRVDIQKQRFSSVGVPSLTQGNASVLYEVINIGRLCNFNYIS